MEKKKMNDKGFSLVELIIVIAIMAILIGVLAPQYLKFVERSRKSADRQNVDEIIRAVEIYAADPEANPQIKTDSTGTKVTISVGGALTVGSGDNQNAITEALKATGIMASDGTSDAKLKSSKWTATTIDLTFTVDSNGNIKVTATDPDILKSSSATPTP